MLCIQNVLSGSNIPGIGPLGILFGPLGFLGVAPVTHPVLLGTPGGPLDGLLAASSAANSVGHSVGHSVASSAGIRQSTAAIRCRPIRDRAKGKGRRPPRLGRTARHGTARERRGVARGSGRRGNLSTPDHLENVPFPSLPPLPCRPSAAAVLPAMAAARPSPRPRGAPWSRT